MTGAIFDVVARGYEDSFYTEDPTVSFFESSFAQCTPFARESVELPVNGEVGFGHTLNIPLHKRGDMVGKVYVKIKLPGIRHKSEPSVRRRKPYAQWEEESSPDSSSSDSTGKSNSMPHKFCYWGNSIAHLVIDYVSFQIGGVDVDKHYGEWMEIHDEYTCKPGKPTDELVGRFHRERDLWKHSRKHQTRYAPLKFFFCEHIGKALPVVVIHRSSVRLQLKLRGLHDCYYSSDGSVPMLMDSNNELSDRDIKLNVYANVFHVSDYERDDMNDADHTYLITQNQFNNGQVISCPSSATNAPVIAKLPFQHPITEIIFTIQAEEHIKNKDWYNWSGKNGEDPLAAVKMMCNQAERLSIREGKWCRLIEPLEHHTCLPKRHIYSYSFALFPEEKGFPSGSLNFSILEDVTLHLILQKGLGTCIFKCWAQNLQMLRIWDGKIGVAYC